MASFVVSQFATFSERLRDDEIESLVDTVTWSLDMFAVYGSLTMATAAGPVISSRISTKLPATFETAYAPVITMNVEAS